MAIWQFGFYLIPNVSLQREHGHIPNELADYVPRNVDSEFDESREYIDYWADIEIPVAIKAQISKKLPPMESWSDEALMYGSDEGARVEIWTDDFLCLIDAISADLELLRWYVLVASELDCQIVLRENGKVLAPELKLIMQAFEGSLARRFVAKPEQTLKSLKNK